MEKISMVTIEGIGPVVFERSRRARHLNISVRPVKGVRVAVPYGVSFEKALDAVRSKMRWIQKHLARMKKVEREIDSRLKNHDTIDRAEAKKKLTCRLRDLSVRYGFSYNKVFIRNQRTRWGSCSSKNNISLNMNLVRLPDELIDYVLVHELIHTRIKNHSKHFWAELNRIVGDARALKSRLKDYSLGLSDEI